MFTGLVEATGVLKERTSRPPGSRVSIATALSHLELGESIAVNGVCLTVAAVGAERFEADISEETARCTTLGRLPIGAVLNLERSLSLGARLGGHLVLGHVDGIARVESSTPSGEAWRVVLRSPPELSRFIAPKGSVALDGVSLTVNRRSGGDFEVMLIPHTQSVTNLNELRPGRELNLEIDLLARYVVHWMEETGTAPTAAGGLGAALERAGFVK
ncbi:MAG TPA: riboflavin synthase [Polyangiaceae bacterium]|nr:riboflavin synthase [Polyangiaceae bacterium]